MKGLAMDYHAILEVLSKLEQWSSASTYREQSLLCLERLSMDRQPRLWASFQVKLGMSYLLEPQLENRVLQTCIQALQHALSVEELLPEERATSLFHLGQLLQYADPDDEQALRSRIKAREAYLETGDIRFQMPTRVGLCLDRYSLAIMFQGLDFSWAIQDARAILKASDPVLNSDDWGIAQLILGYCYFESDEPESALEAFRLAFTCLPRERLPLFWEEGKLEMAQLLLADAQGIGLQVLDEAINACRAGLHFLDEDPRELVAELNHTLADALLMRHRLKTSVDLSEALEACRKALRLRDLNTDFKEIVEGFATLGHLLEATAGTFTQVEKRMIRRLEALLIRKKALFDEDFLGSCLVHLAKLKGLPFLSSRSALLKGIEWVEHALALKGFTLPDDRRDAFFTLGELAYVGATRYGLDTLEKALDAFKMAQTLTDAERDPVVYGQILVNMGAIYANFSGVKGPYYEDSIRCLKQAQQYLSPDNDPRAWCQLHENLGQCLMNRIQGDRFDNIDEARQLLTQTLELLPSSVSPYHWARMSMLLGTLWDSREKGEKDDNREHAIQYYLNALGIFRPDTFPMDWVEATLHLASCYLYRKKGDQRANLDQVQRLLDELDRSKIRLGPGNQIFFLLISGSLYKDYGLGGTVYDAIKSFRKALKIQIKHSKGSKWAMINTFLGAAYCQLLRQNDQHQYKCAIHYFKQALSFFSAETNPYMCRTVNAELGNLYYQKGKWQRAAAYYAQAIEINEWLYHETFFLPHAEIELSEFPDLYARAAFVSAHRGDGAQAVMLLEENRARSFRQAVQCDQRSSSETENFDTPPFHDYQRASQVLFRSIQEDWLFSDAREGRLHGMERHAEREKIVQAKSLIEKSRRQLEHLAEKNTFMPTVTLEEMVRLTRGRALVYLLTVEWGSVALWVRSATEVVIIHVDNYCKSDLVVELDEDEDLPEGTLGEGQVDNQPLSEEVLQGALKEVGTRLMAPIVRVLKQAGVHRAVFIPYGILGMLPLHAAFLSEAEGHIIDHLELTFVPSALVLKVGNERLQRLSARKQTLLAVTNPMPHPVPLPFSVGENAAGAYAFPNTLSLTGTEANVSNWEDRIKYATHLHLACHGVFDTSDLLASRLELAHGEHLSLRNLFLMSEKSEKRWVFLSVCQSALFRFEHLPNEVTGLALAFLQNGAAGVIASLWPLNDFATCILVMRFFEERSQHAFEDVDAPFQAGGDLARAQLWLRNLTAEGLRLWFAERPYLNSLPQQFQERVMRQLDLYKPDSLLFSRAIDWAPLIFIGI